ncbi:MAG: hypothetical protein AB7O24_32860 [Kofleriaceae bacterium]
MPEILTKHPEIVKKVLVSEGAQCGTGATAKILTKCPKEKFCSLAGGEICIYGPSELADMNQLTRTDVCAAATVVPAQPGTGAPMFPGFGGTAGFADLMLSVPLVLAGILTVALWSSPRNRHARG